MSYMSGNYIVTILQDTYHILLMLIGGHIAFGVPGTTLAEKSLVIVEMGLERGH